MVVFIILACSQKRHNFSNIYSFVYAFSMYKCDRPIYVDTAYAETLADPYYRRVPLPKIPGYRKLDREAQLACFADAIQNVPTQTPQLANMVSSYAYNIQDAISLHRNHVTRTRYNTTLANYETPTDHRYQQIRTSIDS